MNTYLLIGAIAVVFGGLGGVLFGLWFGERGRRKDLMWYTSLMQRPNDLGRPAEIERFVDPDDSARRRAEIAVVQSGLEAEALAEGKHYTDEELHEEAMRLVTQMNSDFER